MKKFTKKLILTTAFVFTTGVSFSQVPAHTFTTGTAIPEDGNWTNSSIVFDTTDAIFIANDFFIHIASVPGVGAPQEILWGINQTEGAYLKIFMPPGIGQINMGVNAYALAASQCVKTTVIGEYAINDPMPTGSAGTTGGETWAWGCGSFSRTILRTFDINQEAYLVYGIYNEDNLYSGGFSPNDLQFTFKVTDSVAFWTWARGTTGNLSINQVEKDIFTIYPNPTKNCVSITGTGKVNNYRIVDLSGKIVQSNESFNDTKIDFSNLDNGMYLLMLQTDKGTTTKRIIKE